MKVIAPKDFSWVALLGRPVEKGDEFDVDDVVGAALTYQGWPTSDVDNLTALSVKELRTLAADRDVDLDGATKKTDIIAVLEQAAAMSSTSPDDASSGAHDQEPDE